VAQAKADEIQNTGARALGAFSPSSCEALFAVSIRDALRQVERPLYLVEHEGDLQVAHEGTIRLGEGELSREECPLLAYVAPQPLDRLGDPTFLRDLGIAYPYMAGSMANGIASTELVAALAREGMLASYGAAGQEIGQVSGALDRLAGVRDRTCCFNLIHSPQEPLVERDVVELYLRRDVRVVEASAYLDLTLPAVRFRTHGLHRDVDGRIVAPHRIIAKASRVEVARRWFSPPPEALLRRLVESGDLTEAQARLARHVPMAQDVTAEADSGGHTDNRPLVALLPTFLTLAERMRREHGFADPLRVGAAGGIATPASVFASFAMGAAYVVGGSIHQACVESGTSDRVRKMLSEAEQADVAMAPAADMFEMGVRLQVLKRGTLFAMRAQKLYDLYRNHSCLEEIPAAELHKLEQTVFRAPVSEVWEQTCEFFRARDPGQIERAGHDARHKMALVFRWYLGLSSIWANAGDPDRTADYQVWCGPSMGAFNEWTRHSFLEAPKERSVVAVAFNLLFGAAVLARIDGLRRQGIRVAGDGELVRPLKLAQIQSYLKLPLLQASQVA